MKKSTWNRATVGGLVAAVVVGTAGVAAATTDVGSPSVTPAAASSSAPADPSSTGKDKAAKDGKKAKEAVAKRLKSVQHATWVAKDKDKPGSFITHDLINGSITAVSGTSITVKADDGVSMTFAITADTKVRVRTAGKGAEAAASDLKVGEKAVVTGTGTDSLTATHVVAVAA